MRRETPSRASGSPAVVVVNFNGAELLPRLLRALRDQTVTAGRVIVVDNGSKDGSTEVIRRGFPEVHLVEAGRNLGFAAANNVGVEVAAGFDTVALLNPDAFPEPGWIEALVGAAAEHPEAAAFASRMLKERDPRLLDGAGDDYHVSGLGWRRGEGSPIGSVAGAETPREVFSACAGAALYRREAFVEVGGFDERFFAYFEDTDLAFRLRLAGHGCRYVPDAVVRHIGHATTGVASDFTVYHSHRNMVWTWARDMPGPLLVLYLPLHLLVNALSMASFARQGKGRVIVRAKRDALRGLPGALRGRRALHAGRRVGSLEIRRAMSTGHEMEAAMPSLGAARAALRRALRR